MNKFKISCLLFILCLSLSSVCFVGCNSNNDVLSDVPTCIGYKINNKETYFTEDDKLLLNNRQDLQSKNAIKLMSYKTEDLKTYDHVVNTNEKFEISFIIKNPKKDTILTITIDDTYAGKNKIYSSQSEKYNIKDITTEFIEDKNTYHTYVTINITSCDIETERFLTIKEIDFVRESKDKKTKCNNDIKDVRVFTKIPTNTLTLTANKSVLKKNETCELIVEKNPSNATMDDVVFTLTNENSSVILTNNIVTCVDDSFSEPVKIKATLDGVDSNEILIYPNTPIDSATSLNNIRNFPSGYFYLMSDIDLNGFEWEPIDSFYGELDGNNYDIKNLNISKSNEIASFIINNYGIVRNIKVSNANIEGINAGIVCSRNYGTLLRCFVSGHSTTKSSGEAWSHAGLLVAYNHNKISQCSAIGTINGIGQSILGGIAAYNMKNGSNSPIIKDCFTEVLCNNGLYYGGIVGNNVYSGTIENCISISINNITEASGSQNNNCKIENCLVLGSMNVVGSNVQTPYIINSVAFKVFQDDLNDKNFYIETMKFSEDIWNFDNLDFNNKNYPTLK